MNNVSIGDFRRINKTTARGLFDDGKTIRICPAKTNPDNVWGHYADIDYDDGEADFDSLVNAYTFYNCNAELGRYPAFYYRDTKAKK